jgi:transcriptional regulator with XRE-family HTH domain
MAVSLPQHRKKLGEAVRQCRKAAEFTQEKLAEKASLSTVFISDVERGIENISVDALARIARALKLRVSDLTKDI